MNNTYIKKIDWDFDHMITRYGKVTCDNVDKLRDIIDNIDLLPCKSITCVDCIFFDEYDHLYFYILITEDRCGFACITRFERDTQLMLQYDSIIYKYPQSNIYNYNWYMMMDLKYVYPNDTPTFLIREFRDINGDIIDSSNSECFDIVNKIVNLENQIYIGL